WTGNLVRFQRNEHSILSYKELNFLLGILFPIFTAESLLISGSHGERRRVSADVKNALENDSEWTFDILQLEKVTENHALTQLGIKIFERWKVADSLSCNEDILHRWLFTVEAHYHAGNAYHNATHAADVLQATSYFLDSPTVAGHITENHAIAALLAATVHDLDHPGRGNAFLINTRQSLAVLYNDHSVLENHHVALAFQLTLQQSNNVNIFGNLSREEFTAIRHAMVEMVLATDISRHFEYLVKFNKVDLNVGSPYFRKPLIEQLLLASVIACWQDILELIRYASDERRRCPGRSS
ncbi:PDEase domain-containing protein, partial [Trichostrongylus colubriformis]